jgi:hypothetical protein
MNMKQFRSILAVAVVATSITTSLLPAQAIPLNDILDSAGKSFVRSLFGLPPERKETPQPAEVNNDTPQSQKAAKSGEDSTQNNSSEPSSAQ